MINFNLLGFYWWKEDWWFEVVGIETDEWHGHLFYIDNAGHFDIFFLRDIFRSLKDD